MKGPAFGSALSRSQSPPVVGSGGGCVYPTTRPERENPDMSEYDRPRSMADMVVEQATAAPGETRVTVTSKPHVCPTCGQPTVRVSGADMRVVDL